MVINQIYHNYFWDRKGKKLSFLKIFLRNKGIITLYGV